MFFKFEFECSRTVVLEAASQSRHKLKVSPAVSSWLRKYDIGLNDVPGSGPGGIVLKGDVISYTNSRSLSVSRMQMSAATSKPSLPVFSGILEQSFNDNQLQDKIVAEKLAQSQNKREVPHFHLTAEFECQAFQALCEKELNVSMRAGLLSAISSAVLRFPAVNAKWEGSVIRQYDFVNLEVVSLQEESPSLWISGANQLGVEEFHTIFESYPEEYRSRKGSTFSVWDGLSLSDLTVSRANLGLGSGSCVLALSAPKLTICTDTVRTKLVLPVTLACDHRVVDGAVGAAFLEYLGSVVEQKVSRFL